MLDNLPPESVVAAREILDRGDDVHAAGEELDRGSVQRLDPPRVDEAQNAVLLLESLGRSSAVRTCCRAENRDLCAVPDDFQPCRFRVIRLSSRLAPATATPRARIANRDGSVVVMTSSSHSNVEKFVLVPFGCMKPIRDVAQVADVERPGATVHRRVPTMQRQTHRDSLSARGGTGATAEESPKLLEIGKAEVVGTAHRSRFSARQHVRMAKKRPKTLRAGRHFCGRHQPGGQAAGRCHDRVLRPQRGRRRHIEDHVLHNGFGAAIIEHLADAGVATPVVRVGCPTNLSNTQCGHSP